MMRAFIGGVALLISAQASAQCVGSETFMTCTDQSGNTVTVNRLGDMTMLNGTNARTGSSWNQQTMHGPSMSTTTGNDSRGRSWNSMSSAAGTTGTDSDGNSFYAPPPPRRYGR